VRPLEHLTQRGKVQRLRRVARAALAEYDLDDAHLTFLSDRGNVSFRVDAPRQEARFLLRVYSPEKFSTAAVWSELEWLRALSEDTGLVVPAPVPNRSGALVTEATVDGVPGARACALMRWVEGRSLGFRVTPVQAGRIGGLLARLHRHAENWPQPAGFERPCYDLDRLCAAVEKLRPAVQEGIIPEPVFNVFAAGVEHGREVVERLEQRSDAFGLIHLDLHEGNRLFYRAEVRPIDFSECGLGYYLYDIASALLSLFPRHSRSLVEGYQALRSLPEDYRPLIEAFLVIAIVNNMVFLASRPEEHESLRSSRWRVAAMIEQVYLRGEPFLFGWDRELV
jgi:Ser/Thr protein kinase RdoA (MazF antagonist)